MLADGDVVDQGAYVRRVSCGAHFGTSRCAIPSATRSERGPRARITNALGELQPNAALDAAAILSVGALLAEFAHTTGTTVVLRDARPAAFDLADRELRLGQPAGVAST